jgi:hypothetical protein
MGLLTTALLVARPVAATVLAGVSMARSASLLSGLTRLDVAPIGHLTAFVTAGIFVGVMVVRHNKQRRIHGPSLLRTK